MPRKELSPPDENRKRAERLTDGDAEKAVGKSVSTVKNAADDRFAAGSSDEKTPEKSNRPTARQYAMSLVAARTYTERGLREKLRIRGYGCDETDDAVDYLKGFGYVNDLRIAQNAAEKLAEKGNGKRKIFAYLASKGISREVIAEIDLSEFDFKESCLLAAEKLAAKGKRPDQIMRSLSASGFSSSEITYAMEHLS